MDLSTEYLGFQLPHPLMAGASPLSDDLDTVRRLEDAGVAAIVLRSLFEEQLRAEELATHASTDTHAESFGEALSYFPSPDEFVLGPDEYLEHLRKVKAAVGVPVIASLNGTTMGGWLGYARQLAEAGADALELNFYYLTTDPGEAAETIERQAIEMVGSVKKAVGVPVAIKLAPFHTALAHFAVGLVEAGADGLVLFNRTFKPDINTEELEVLSQLGLSDSSELQLRLRWLAVLSAKTKASMAITGGVHTALDAVKAVMCGANAVQMVSALLKNGPQHLTKVREGLAAWLQEKEYDSLRQAQGSMNLDRCPNPKAYERGNYARMLQTWQQG